MSRRQDPVSCALCRRKKLRCSRQQPCSNCVSRGVGCEREVALPGRAPPVSSAQGTTGSSHQGETESSGWVGLCSPPVVSTQFGRPLVSQNGQHDVLARLERVESLLQRLDARVLGLQNDTPATSPAYLSTPRSGPHSIHSAPNYGNFGPGDYQNNTVAEHQADSHLLENIGTRHRSFNVALANPTYFQVLPIAEIASNVAVDTLWNGIVVPMPTRAEAYRLMAVYEEHIEFLHHVTYTPRTRAAFEEVYDAIEQRTTPQYGAAALLTSIFASATAFQYAIGAKKDLLGLSPDVAQRACHKWAKATYDCTEISSRMGRCSIQDFQALVTIFFLMYNLEGFSSRSRMGLGLGIGIARDLSLHRVDDPIMTEHGIIDAEDMIDIEVKRRGFWHMAATDWQAGVTGGPQEGTYSIQPRHIATRLPRHIEEEDLVTQGPTFERPLSEATDSSYLIQRIRLAEICRKSIDFMPLGAWGSKSTRYEDVVSLDLEFERFKKELPPFFQDTPEASVRYCDVYQKRPNILVQKYTVNIIFQNRRCKLHQPWLVRGFADPAYARSRDVCLQSARAVMAISKQLDTEKVVAASLLSMSGVQHHMFFAAVALVMDLCFNKTTGEDETERRAEVMEACRRLGQAKDRSPMAKTFMDSLMDVLRKHKIRCFDPVPAPESSLPRDLEPQIGPSDLPDFDPAGTTQSDFEEIWQSYIENGASLDVPEWTELFDDLQSTAK